MFLSRREKGTFRASQVVDADDLLSYLDDATLFAL